MKSHQTIFNRDLATVTITQEEYEKLLEYKKLCKEYDAALKGDAL